MSEQQHCEHECVCPDWRAANSDEDEDPEPCNISCMQRMTRPHPAPAPAAVGDSDAVLYQRGYNDGVQHERGQVLIRVIAILEKEYFWWDCEEKNADKEEAACNALSSAMRKIEKIAAIRKAEREQILTALERDCKGRYVEDAVMEIRRFPESLRSTTEQPKEARR